jgi:hypothetical protein
MMEVQPSQVTNCISIRWMMETGVKFITERASQLFTLTKFKALKEDFTIDSNL